MGNYTFSPGAGDYIVQAVHTQAHCFRANR
jgi:hypothetical protein